MKNNMWAAMILISSLASSYATSLSACVVAPTIEQSNQTLRDGLNSADMMFVGQVQRITKRRWTEDDQMGLYEQRLLEWQAEGREISEERKRILIFSDAEARLSIDIFMKDSGFGEQQPFHRSHFGNPEVDLDLLRPVRSAGDGSCSSFPKPCPWNIKVGDWVAVALDEQPLQAPATLYCTKINPPDRGIREQIEALRGIVEPAQLFWLFREGDWPFDETANAPPASPSSSIRPRLRPTSGE
jgi:hypothetical protein